jgi:hypothetical protein
MLLSEARRPTRLAADGAMVRLADQDRTRWEQTLITEGHELVRACLRRNQPGPFQIQAAIAAVHADASDGGSTDWSQVVALYNQLYALRPILVVALNRSVAVVELHGPEKGLAALAEIDTPAWTADFGFDPAMGQDIGNLMPGCQAILLGRNTYEMFAPAWSSPTTEEDPLSRGAGRASFRTGRRPPGRWIAAQPTTTGWSTWYTGLPNFLTTGPGWRWGPRIAIQGAGGRCPAARGPPGATRPPRRAPAGRPGS